MAFNCNVLSYSVIPFHIVFNFILCKFILFCSLFFYSTILYLLFYFIQFYSIFFDDVILLIFLFYFILFYNSTSFIDVFFYSIFYNIFLLYSYIDLDIGIELIDRPHLSPGSSVPQDGGCTGTPVTGLHISRFLCHTIHSTVSFSPASTGQTHHLSPLDTRPARRRTLREKQ